MSCVIAASASVSACILGWILTARNRLFASLESQWPFGIPNLCRPLPFRQIGHHGTYGSHLLHQALVKNNLGKEAFPGPLHRLQINRVVRVSALAGIRLYFFYQSRCDRRFQRLMISASGFADLPDDEFCMQSASGMDSLQDVDEIARLDP
ncbi:hypothetical protein PE067_14785 [Paracoccus sp. DMF-8]|uniref:hypothetical protein n=1 Tax=Paracoccus sp. DMF-8 TaxID=3019445 RepID=UPI0023E3DC3E|nr:hypothetical protein [Paracoccus sp. DMF-8]MDF3607283.1 hypothetical protein [Paracoccus sp. DMF-8]